MIRSRRRNNFINVVAHNLVAFARAFEQTFAVQNLD